MTAYYNENNPYAAQWLRNLILAGHISDGYVDDRSILDVRAHELDGFTQCHFFAGIGGWSHALRIAGWPDDIPVWTGSCPCQPFSRAGKRRGHADDRHLWPAFSNLIAERRPSTIFGEQTSGPLGREWFSGVRADLEDAGYACGAADLPAAGVGAPHIRQRIYWVAHSNGAGRPAWIERAERLGHRSPAVSVGDTSFWVDFEEHKGDDGTLRRTGVRVPAVAPGLPARVAQIGAAGNAIVPPLAAQFIRAASEAIGATRTPE